MPQVFQKVYCAFCRLERNVCSKKHLGWTNVVLCALVSILAMTLIWGEFDPRVIIIFAVAAIIGEIFVRMRWRMTLPCPHCAFDPLLYKTNRSEASARVKVKLDSVKANGGHLLKANNPFQYLPSVIAEERNETTGAKKPSLLSKHI